MLVHYFNSSSFWLPRMAQGAGFVCKNWGDRELNHQLENLITADLDSWEFSANENSKFLLVLIICAITFAQTDTAAESQERWIFLSQSISGLVSNIYYVATI